MNDYLKDISLLDEIDISLLTSVCSIRKYCKGSIIYYEGDTLEYVYILVSGSCKAYKMNDNKEIFLFSVYAGSLISDFSESASNSVEFLSDSIVLSASKDDLFRLVPASKLLSVSITRNQLLNHVIDFNQCFNAVQRVAYTLVNDLEYFNSHKRVVIAARLNLTSETLSRVVSRLQKEKHIVIQDGVCLVVNPAGLTDSYLL